MKHRISQNDMSDSGLLQRGSNKYRKFEFADRTSLEHIGDTTPDFGSA